MTAIDPLPREKEEGLLATDHPLRLRFWGEEKSPKGYEGKLRTSGSGQGWACEAIQAFLAKRKQRKRL